MGLYASLNNKETSEQIPRGEGVGSAQRQEVSNLTHQYLKVILLWKAFEVTSCTAT